MVRGGRAKCTIQSDGRPRICPETAGRDIFDHANDLRSDVINRCTQAAFGLVPPIRKGLQHRPLGAFALSRGRGVAPFAPPVPPPRRTRCPACRAANQLEPAAVEPQPLETPVLPNAYNPHPHRRRNRLPTEGTCARAPTLLR